MKERKKEWLISFLSRFFSWCFRDFEYFLLKTIDRVFAFFRLSFVTLLSLSLSLSFFSWPFHSYILIVAWLNKRTSNTRKKKKNFFFLCVVYFIFRTHSIQISQFKKRFHFFFLSLIRLKRGVNLVVSLVESA